MRHATTVVIGAGHCGLAVSRCLAAHSVDHVVLERGEVAHSWRTQRWDSLRLLTPSWMTRLPGNTYRGDDPDGYLSVPEVIRFLGEYATGAPVLTGVAVTSVQPLDQGYLVRTDRGAWRARTVVVATGGSAAAARPSVPLPPGIPTVTAAGYRNPGQLPDGGVLVVGASASGIQIAEELSRSGRPVTLAVGEHVRLPRTYRGRDVLWWMDASGLLDERWDAVPDLVRARNLPSMQLVGAPRTLDLDVLRRQGVALVGRLAGARDDTVQFSGSLANVCALADLKLGRLLDMFDAWADRAGVEAEAPQRFAPTAVPAPVLSAQLGRGGIESVVWATGFRPDLSFLEVPVFDRRGRIVHDGGVTAAPGLYVMGLPFLRRRKSTLIDGADGDARALTAHLVDHLDTLARRAS
ncbi:NAD(P)-binding domain-containing protein [Pseudonocardia kujensis]|uniref:NAD(P)-binding domain-containing protein n=1 Tax=Pseudonocardia kujensis TaxID=1128675 RepID=UPI001E4F226B|nr:NAD(P)-binding domain-containing protein [Pseudonocardia kujensis]MCE0765411.1 NAD(P)-binding domain-containing protein [Pseudonocardia kujensis]